MAGKLLLRSVQCDSGMMKLGFAIGEPVTVEGGGKRRDLPGGLVEYETVVTQGEQAFAVRASADADGTVRAVVASTGPIPENWHEPKTEEPLHGGTVPGQL